MVNGIIEDSIKEFKLQYLKDIKYIEIKKYNDKYVAIVVFVYTANKKSIEYTIYPTKKEIFGEGLLLSRESFRVFDVKCDGELKKYCWGKVISYIDSNLEFLKLNNISLNLSNEYLSEDKPFLMPINKKGKIGFINHCGEIVFEPTFDEYDGVLPSSPYERYGDILVKENGKWGVIDCEKYVLDTKYDKILRCKTYEDDYRAYRIYTAQKGTKYYVYHFDGGIMIHPHIDKYNYVSGFDSYLAIVKKGNKYGLIDVYGDIVLPIEYDKIDEFYGKELKCTKAFKNGKVFIIKFSDLVPVKPEYNPYNTESPQYDDYDSYDNSDAYNNPYYNDALDFDQQEPEFWETL